MLGNTPPHHNTSWGSTFRHHLGKHSRPPIYQHYIVFFDNECNLVENKNNRRVQSCSNREQNNVTFCSNGGASLLLLVISESKHTTQSNTITWTRECNNRPASSSEAGHHNETPSITPALTHSLHVLETWCKLNWIQQQQQQYAHCNHVY